MRRESVTVYDSPGTDAMGDPLEPLAPRVIKGCRVLPRTSTNDAERGVVPISGYDVFAPRGTKINAMARVEVRGVLGDVEGEPADYGKAVRFMTRTTGVPSA